jgi:ubiquinone/menaquinone biosynthesis C-methylase UbiE
MSNRTEWADFFNGHAPEYDDNCFTRNTPAEIKFLLAELSVPAGGSVLDIGCGTGRHTVALAQLGYHVTGLDISAEMLAKAQARADAAGVDVDLREGDATEFSLPPSLMPPSASAKGRLVSSAPRTTPLSNPWQSSGT